jgi:hypothetical protein
MQNVKQEDEVRKHKAYFSYTNITMNNAYCVRYILTCTAVRKLAVLPSQLMDCYTDGAFIIPFLLKISGDGWD